MISSVAAVVDGKHEAGEAVTITGHATSPLAINFNGGWRDTFLLISEIRPRKAVRVEISALDQAECAALLEPVVIDGASQPPLLDVAGTVGEWEAIYFVVASEIKAVG